VDALIYIPIQLNMADVNGPDWKSRWSVRRIVRNLGLKCAKNNGSADRGRTTFDDVRVKELAAAVNSLKADLPPGTDKGSRLAFLTQKTIEILEAHGQAVWGEHGTREWLLKASDGVNDYTKDRVYEDKADRQVQINPKLPYLLLTNTNYRLEENINLWILAVSRVFMTNSLTESKRVPATRDADPEAPPLLPPISAATRSTRSPAMAYAPEVYWEESQWLALTRASTIPYIDFIWYLGLRRDHVRDARRCGMHLTK
jgi:hypothetical protein